MICGYSFADEHINAYIEQGLSGNPNASCIAMIFKDRVDVPKAITLAKRHANLTVLAADGGIVGTVDRSWHNTVMLQPAYRLTVGTELPGWRTKAPAEQCKWLLGDFAAFGEFLAYQLSSRDIDRTCRMRPDPTRIGTVQDVAGTAISVSLVNESATGLSFFKGESYRIGQVGSFVRIPLGYTSLFGIVSQVGAGAAPSRDGDTHPWGNQWLKVQLVGERGREGCFERGVSQHPTINDPVHIVTEDDLREIYGPGDPTDFVSVGHLASAESIPALVNINRLVTRPFGCSGNNRFGQSTTVAGLLAALSNPTRYPSTRIVILDIHGEYAKALGDRSTVYRVTPDIEKGDKPLHIPFWALSFDELAKLAFGNLGEQQIAAVTDAIIVLKREALSKQPRDGVSMERLSADTPVPFCLHKLWFDFHQREHRTVVPKPGAGADEVDPLMC